MKTKHIILLAGLILAGAVCGLLLLRHPTEKTRHYTLGVSGNFKGKNAQVGVEAFNAIILAYDEYKKARPNGFDLQILPVDDSWDPAKTLPAYLSCADNVDLLILLSSSSSIMRLYDEIRKRPDIIHAILGPTTTLLSGLNDNVVRNLCDMEKEQKMIAQFASARNIHKLLLVMETEFNPKYTEQATDYFKKHTSIPQIDIAQFSGNLMNLEQVQQRLKENRYDALYAMVGGMPRETAILIQKARAIQPGIPVLITPWTRGLVFEQALGAETNAIFMPSHLKLVDNPRYNHFLSAYQKMFGAETKEYFAPLMYDLAHSLFSALDRAGTTKTGTLLPILLKEENEGTIGPARFDSFGDANSVLYFHEMKDGQWRFLDPKVHTAAPPMEPPQR